MKIINFGHRFANFISPLVLPLIFLATAQAHAEKKQVWIYTSIYKEFITPIKEAFEKKNPDIEAQIYQGGSEKLQAKLEAELLSHRIQADILLTSDPFWSHDLDQRNLLFQRPGHKTVETNYYSLMILISHKDFPLKSRPTSFQDLTKPEFKDLIQAGSPLESGTAFTMVAYLAKKYGWNYFKKLHENNLSSNGGNSTVIQKVESGEKKIGIVLLENALAGIKRGSPIEIIYPSDGAIPIPSVQIIPKEAPNKDSAQKFADFILSPEGQKLLRAGFMYGIGADSIAPEGAKPLGEVTKKSLPMTPDFIAETQKDSRSIKKQFSQIILQ